MTIFNELTKLKEKLDSFRPLSPEVVSNLHEDLVLRWTYNSNAIEGNTLTLKETKVALEGITVGGKTLREHFEAINHREAFVFVESLVSDESPFSEHVIKSVHQLILKNIDDENAGVYRRSNVIISGAQHVPPEAVSLGSLMGSFIEWYRSEAQSLHPVERAARVHCDFVKIHPFSDGNGRTSRLLMNLELMKSGYPAVVMPVSRRLEYYEALDKAHVDKEYSSFIELISEMVRESFNPYWFALGVDK